MTSLRTAVIDKYGLMPDMITHDLRISKQTAAAVCRPDVRDLVPGEAEVLSDGDSAPCSPRKTPRDVRDSEGDTGMSTGSWSSSDDTDQELFLEAYSSFKKRSLVILARLERSKI